MSPVAGVFGGWNSSGISADSVSMGGAMSTVSNLGRRFDGRTRALGLEDFLRSDFSESDGFGFFGETTGSVFTGSRGNDQYL
jgi:hypothetical protein